MRKYYKMSLPKILFLIIILISLIGIILNPVLSLDSARSGLSVWFSIVIPSLLPFFIISEILIQIGFVDFIGKLLEPFMKPLFNLPGNTAFPITMSLISGYPVGVKLTSRLREEKLITKNEGDRLISFTSTSGPLFMLGGVSIGMLQDPSLAPLILIPHYLSFLILGILSNFFPRRKKISFAKSNTSIFNDIKYLYNDWLKTKKSIGSLITKSIKESMDTIILIGGLIVFYSVLVEIVFNMNLINKILHNLSSFLSLNYDLVKGFFSGIFEVTIGCKNVASSNSSLITKILAINFLIGWSGLSIHSQAFSFINSTDINGKKYIVSKFFHGVISAIITYILYLIKYKNHIQPIFKDFGSIFGPISVSNWVGLIISSTKLALLMGMYIFLIAMLVFIIFKLIISLP